jgi:hypothetical protein
VVEERKTESEDEDEDARSITREETGWPEEEESWGEERSAGLLSKGAWVVLVLGLGGRGVDDIMSLGEYLL